MQCYLCACGSLSQAEGHHCNNHTARCVNTRSIHSAALSFALQPARSHALLGSWRLALADRATDLSSRLALDFHMFPQSRALPESAVVAPPSKLLPTQARQCSNVPSVAATNAQAQLHAQAARAVCVLLGDAMFNSSSREVEANSLTILRPQKRCQFLARKFAFQLRAACAQAGAAACSVAVCGATASH